MLILTNRSMPEKLRKILEEQARRWSLQSRQDEYQAAESHLPRHTPLHLSR